MEPIPLVLHPYPLSYHSIVIDSGLTCEFINDIEIELTSAVALWHDVTEVHI